MGHFSIFPLLLLQNTVPYLCCLSPLINTVLSLGPYTANYISVLPFVSPQKKIARCCSASAIPVLEEPSETIWRLVNAVLTCQSTRTFNFDNFFVLSDIILVGMEK